MTTSAGVWISVNENSTRLQVVAPREIRYSTVHPQGYIFSASHSAIVHEIGDRPLLAVVDRNVDAIYGHDIRTYLSSHMDCRGYLLAEGSETVKNWTQVERICEEAISVSMPRHGVILAIGGGVILDVAGFAASVFRRGINYVRIPTSLIGMVDVAVGIKQGINVGSKKSIVGAFYPAMVNINDPTFLSTIPRRHLSCGTAEIIKMALVRDAALFCMLESHTAQLIAEHYQNSPAREVLLRAEQLMMQELQPNLYEHELRRLPDFGHSFSPAMETASGHSINHGEAVAMDMLLSTAIAVNKRLCSEDVFLRLRSLLLAAGLPLTHSVCQADVLHKGLRDVRDHRAGNLNLVVPRGIGEADFVQSITREEIEEGLAYVGAAGGSWRHESAMRLVA